MAKDFPTRRRGRASNRAVLVMLLVVVLGTWYTHNHNKSKGVVAADDPVRSTVHAALTIDQALNLPPAASPTAAQVTMQRETGATAVRAVFTGTAAKQEIAKLEGVIAKQADNDVTILAASISNLAYQSVTVNGTTADVHCTVKTFVRSSSKDPDMNVTTTESRGQLNVTMKLTQSNAGQWLVSEMTSVNLTASGSQPPP